MEAVDAFLESLAHLHLVDEDDVLGVGTVLRLDVFIERVIFEEPLELNQVEVDLDDVCTWDGLAGAMSQGLHELRLAAATHARDYLDVWGAHDIPEPV
nr:hypothetical protein [Olsenella sp. Marseille-P4559]